MKHHPTEEEKKDEKKKIKEQFSTLKISQRQQIFPNSMQD